ncbi:MAG: hypothetical protein GF334_09170 [Candidatus Altiarchaeales archaeon]|nr:hypothetical protein [Candidatus Altiarchaeales archaeon]
MCGLFGVSSNWLSKAEIDNAALLGYLSYTRGVDSTGLAFVGKKGKKHRAQYLKEPSPSGVFLHEPETERFLGSGTSNNILLGHTRAATIGKVNKENAQPFWIDPIIGTHNGQVGAFNPLKGEEMSDSYYFYECLASSDLKDTLEYAYLDDLCAYALVWYDFRTSTLNMFRNDKRPLFKMSSHNGTTYWASERWMLEVVDRKSLVAYQPIHMLAEDTLYTQKLGEKHWHSEKIAVPKKYRPAAAAKTYPNNPPWQYEVVDTSKNSDLLLSNLEEKRARAEKEQPEKGENNKSLYLEPEAGTKNLFVLPDVTNKQDVEYYIKAYGNKIYTLDEMKDILFRNRDGCIYCGNQISDVTEKVHWASEEDYVCHDCYTSPDFRQMEAITSSSTKYYESKLAVKPAA